MLTGRVILVLWVWICCEGQGGGDVIPEAETWSIGCSFIQQMKTALKIAAGESSSDQFKPKIRPNNGFLAVGDGGPTLTFLA